MQLKHNNKYHASSFLIVSSQTQTYVQRKPSRDDLKGTALSVEKLETVTTVQSDGANTVTEDSSGKRTPNSPHDSCNEKNTCIYLINSCNMATVGHVMILPMEACCMV